MFRLTEKHIKKVFEEELVNFEFPCSVEIKEGLPDDEHTSSGFTLNKYKAMGMTHTKVTYKRDVPDELCGVSFYPESFIYNCWSDLHDSIPNAVGNTIMWLVSNVGIGISEKKMRDSIRKTIAHEYRHCMQFQYIIENGLDMGSYHKDEKWGIYGLGRLESDAIAYADGKIKPIEEVFSDKKYYKKDWTWFDAMLA
jgi:hypothetical protein